MSDYSSGYDPKYGYNRNAFAHKTLGMAVMGRVVKIIVTLLGLVSEAIHARKDKRRPSSDAAAREAGLNLSVVEDVSSKKSAISTEGHVEKKDLAFVEVPPEVADELIASGQAEPTEGQAPTHELVLNDKGDDGVDRDEADWALDEAAAEGEDEEPASSSKKDENPEERFANRTQPSVASSAASERSMQKLPFQIIVPQRRQYESPWLCTCLPARPRRNWNLSRRIPMVSQEASQSCTGLPHLRRCYYRHSNCRSLPGPHCWSCGAGCPGGGGDWTGDSRKVPHQQIFVTGK